MTSIKEKHFFIPNLIKLYLTWRTWFKQLIFSNEKQELQLEINWLFTQIIKLTFKSLLKKIKYVLYMTHPILPALRAGRIGWAIKFFPTRSQKIHPTFTASFARKNFQKLFQKKYFKNFFLNFQNWKIFSSRKISR